MDDFLWGLAGACGVDPGPYTLRELVKMADGRRREAWAHTSSLMALVANANRNEKKRSKPFDADDFNPYSAKRGPATFEIGKDIAWDDFARMMSGVKPKPPC